MLEVFLSYTGDMRVDDLEHTLEAWDQKGLEPVALECSGAKFEMHRRVTAENISLGDYVLGTVGAVPVEDNFAELAEKVLAENPQAGLIKIPSRDTDWV